MDNIVNFIKDYEGIFGAILGSAITLIITDILRKKGKIKFYLMNYNGEYWYESKEKYYGPTKDKEYGQDIESYRFQFTLDIYNTSELPKIMRDLKIKVYKDKKFLTSIPVNDEDDYYNEDEDVTSVITNKILKLFETFLQFFLQKAKESLTFAPCFS